MSIECGICGKMVDSVVAQDGGGPGICRSCSARIDIQQHFSNGVRAMRTLIREELDRKDHVMPHQHNPDVLKDAQWEYCWRCKIERVLDTEIAAYSLLDRGPKTSEQVVGGLCDARYEEAGYFLCVLHKGHKPEFHKTRTGKLFAQKH